jgi:hypothetical protein
VERFVVSGHWRGAMHQERFLVVGKYSVRRLPASRCPE